MHKKGERQFEFELPFVVGGGQEVDQSRRPLL